MTVIFSFFPFFTSYGEAVHHICILYMTKTEKLYLRSFCNNCKAESERKFIFPSLSFHCFMSKVSWSHAAKSSIFPQRAHSTILFKFLPSRNCHCFGGMTKNKEKFSNMKVSSHFSLLCLINVTLLTWMNKTEKIPSLCRHRNIFIVVFSSARDIVSCRLLNYMLNLK